MVSIELLLVFYDQIAKNVMHFFLSASFLCSLLCLMENTYASVPKKAFARNSFNYNPKNRI